MSGSFDTTIEQLKALDRSRKYSELAERLRRLPPNLTQSDRALVAYWQGKLAILGGDDARAIASLARAVALAPDNPASHYLLGASLARAQQWLDARNALLRALELQPALEAARLELAAVHLALGHPHAAVRLLAPLPDRPEGRLRGLRATAAVQVEPDPLVAASLAAAALAQNSRLPQSLLIDWLRFTGGLLLTGRCSEGRAWLEALMLVTPSAAAIANPVPRRITLIAWLLLEAIEPGPTDLRPWCQQLDQVCWLLPSTAEHQLWDAWLESWVMLVIGRLDNLPSRDAGRIAPLLKSVSAALQVIHPPRRNNAGWFLRLDQLRQGMQPDPINGEDDLELALQRHWHDGLHLSIWLERAMQLDDRALHSFRPDLENLLLRWSEQLLQVPQLLVQQPGAEGLQQANHWRQGSLGRLIRCRQRLASCLQALPVHRRPRRHWLLLASDDLPQCYLYRVEQKRQQLEGLGCAVRIVLREQLEDWVWSESLLWADAVIICRLPATAPVLAAIDAVHRAGLPSWYDLDDLVVDPDHGVPELATYGGTITPLQHRCLQLDVPLFAAAMRACNAAIVSTPTLARRWRSLQPDQPVQVLANLAPPELRAALRRPRRSRRHVRLVVASGTKAHKQIWQNELAPALAELLRRHPLLQLDLLGHLQLPLVVQCHSDRIRCWPFTDYSSYLTRLAEADIGLVALEPGLYTDAKSAIRWMEFSYLGLASVLSPSQTYTEILEDGIHARFARGVDEWVTVVEQLLADPRGRRAMARRAQERALALFEPAQAEAFWRPLIGSGPEPAAPLQRRRRRRLLVLNVFFAPNSIGGATRIAQDQVRALCDQLGDDWEVTVLCTDPAPWMQIEPLECSPEDEPEVWELDQPLPVEVHQWHGARVVRLTLPPRSWTQHHDRSVESFCRRWFAQERFDLIHSHCIQVLGVGPLQVARELGIPYAITLHDGWWLSPWLFLLTPAGKAIDVSDPLGHLDDSAKQDKRREQAALERNHCLRDVLQGAKARWAVSEAFADLHRDAGVADVAVMENRWQPMPLDGVRRTRAADQPLRCCYVGGLAVHKGYAVLQAAVLQARPADPGLELTVIDSSLKPGERRTAVWGSTPVRFVAAVPMHQMSAFYAEQDVLLAPSIWPESYGLVSREALSAGLWVVASEIGALADPIRDGENGHRLPAGDVAALGAVLEHLSQQHPQPQVLLAFTGERGPLQEELSRHYEALL